MNKSARPYFVVVLCRRSNLWLLQQGLLSGLLISTIVGTMSSQIVCEGTSPSFITVSESFLSRPLTKDLIDIIKDQMAMLVTAWSLSF